MPEYYLDSEDVYYDEESKTYFDCMGDLVTDFPAHVTVTEDRREFFLKEILKAINYGYSIGIKKGRSEKERELQRAIGLDTGLAAFDRL